MILSIYISWLNDAQLSHFILRTFLAFFVGFLSTVPWHRPESSLPKPPWQGNAGHMFSSIPDGKSLILFMMLWLEPHWSPICLLDSISQKCGIWLSFCMYFFVYPLVMTNIAMGNGAFIEVYLLKMVMFHGYVKSPDGNIEKYVLPNNQYRDRSIPDTLIWTLSNDTRQTLKWGCSFST